jgi:hypothetical protein
MTAVIKEKKRHKIVFEFAPASTRFGWIARNGHARSCFLSRQNLYLLLDKWKVKNELYFKSLDQNVEKFAQNYVTISNTGYISNEENFAIENELIKFKTTYDNTINTDTVLNVENNVTEKEIILNGQNLRNTQDDVFIVTESNFGNADKDKINVKTIAYNKSNNGENNNNNNDDFSIAKRTEEEESKQDAEARYKDFIDTTVSSF